MQICNIYGQGSWSATEVEVELRISFRMVRNRSHVLDNNDKDINVLYKLRPTIDSVVMYRFWSVWSSIAIHNRTQSPEKPTVIVFCHQDPNATSNDLKKKFGNPPKNCKHKAISWDSGGVQLEVTDGGEILFWPSGNHSKIEHQYHSAGVKRAGTLEEQPGFWRGSFSWSFCLTINFGREELMQRRILPAQRIDEPMNFGWKFVIAGPDLVAWGEPFTWKLKIWCFHYKENGL